MKKKRILIVALFLAGTAFFLTGQTSDIQKQIVTREWRLTKLTIDGADVPLPGDTSISFRHMEGNRFTGNCGVNQLTSHFSVNRKGRLSFDSAEGGMTEMAGPDHLMEFETTYTDAFWKIEKATVSGNTLIFTGNHVRMEYAGKKVRPTDRSGNPEDTVTNGAGTGDPKSN